MISVGICDDDPLVLSYLSATLDRLDDIEVAIECGGAHQALAADRVDVWLMDIRMPGISGVEACHMLTSRPDPPQVLLLTSLSTTTLKEALDAGASGYLYKDTPARALAAAIRTAHAGIFVHSPDAARTHTGARNRVHSEGLIRDSVDHDILTRVHAGAPYEQIARELKMSVSGVKKRVGAIMKRAGVSSRPQLMARTADPGRAPAPPGS